MISVLAPHNFTDFAHNGLFISSGDLGFGKDVVDISQYQFVDVDDSDEQDNMPSIYGQCGLGLGNEVSSLYSLSHFLCIREGFVLCFVCNRELGPRQGQWKCRGRSAISHHNLDMSWVVGD